MKPIRSSACLRRPSASSASLDGRRALALEVQRVLDATEREHDEDAGGSQDPEPALRLAADPAQSLLGLEGRRPMGRWNGLEPFDQASQIRAHPGRREGPSRLHVLEEGLVLDVAVVGRLPREQLLEQEPERVHVAGRGGHLAAGLLGAHVAERPHDGPRLGLEPRELCRGRAATLAKAGPQKRGRSSTTAVSWACTGAGAVACEVVLLRSRGSLGLRAARASQPEVHHLGLPLAGHHHVGGLQISMNDVGGMRRHQGPSDLLGDGQLRGLVQAAPERGWQARSIDELQDEPIALVLLDVVVDPTHVGVVELRQEPGLAQEAGLRGRAQTLVAADGLESDLALEGLVEPGIDLAHATHADVFEDAIVGDDPVHVGRSEDTAKVRARLLVTQACREPPCRPPTASNIPGGAALAPVWRPP